MKKRILTAALLATLAVPTLAAEPGEGTVTTFCAGCHGTGVLGAPKLGNAADWEPRLKQGLDTLVDHAINGFNTMPPRGGNPALTDDQVRDAVAFMVKQVEGGGSAQAAAPAPKPAAPPAPEPKAAAAPAPKPAAKPAPKKVAKASNANRFNRLLKGAGERNLPPPEDGIHDDDNEGTFMLQPPLEAFDPMPNATSGNYIDWVKALDSGAINPRYDRVNDAAKPVVMDLNIVREVKGSMPNVVYPHKQHTEWLDCSNCHPAIFIPKKGANQISMAAILLGQKCGVCHGKVAFPVSECRKCHSQKKERGLTPTRSQ
jgi:c(7)-type cytochrome triheme protein